MRNEYGLGQPELYKEANKEDPKAVLDGVAVAGLVGILRQLGDLAEFAAEVFHGLQEQVMATASRSHKLTVRVQRIEAALPPLEKAVLAQTSHIHFAYTAGSEWHPRIQNEQNHFICNDLPRFIMDSYEECHNPPRLHLLDKFDAGGPGSCLKRYSDPTFFRRVSGCTIDATADKIQGEKKARKKRKKSSQRNGEISCVASISNHSGRMHLTSLGVNGQTSSQTPSIVDITMKSDLGDCSKSFDSRTGSGHIDCVFNLGSSLQPGEQGSEESSSRLMQHIDTLDSDFCDESNRTVDDRPHSSPERTIPSSLCVTWDEKAEIGEPKGQQCDSDEVPGAISANFDIDTGDGGTANHTNVDGMDIVLDSEPQEVLSANFDTDTQNSGTAYLRSVDQMDILLDREYQEVLSANFDSDTQVRGTAILQNVGQMDIFPADEDTPKSIDQLDEVESETDNYMDALNTIESESENDLDCQTKWEVEECYSSVNNCKLEDGIQELIEHSSVQYPSSIKSHTVLGVPSSNGLTSNLPDSVPSVSIVHEQKPQISAKSSDSDHSPGTDIYASVDKLDSSKVEPVITDGPKVESVLSDPSSPLSRMSNLHEKSGERTTSSFCDSQQSLDEFSSVHSVKFWTNGGLLGLQPSKPPDFAVSNGNSLNVVVRSNSGPPDTISPKVEGQNEKLEALVENAESYVKVSSASVGKVPVSFADSSSELEKSTGSHSNKFEHGHRGGLNLTAAAASGTELASDVKATSTEANGDNDGNSSLVFGLGHRLLVNGFHKKLSLMHDDNSEPVSSLKTGVFDRGSEQHHDAYQTISKKIFMERFGCGSPLGSLTSSPPLEHMKISFNPVDGSETSKLKLKFPDGRQFPESVRDMFPSFQLVPEPAIPLRDHGSDSDDDTFCRSSPYMSDDCASHHSESNSEQWESSPGGSNDHELYDALCRMSSSESVSSTLQLQRAPKICMHADSGFQSVYTENGAEPSLPSLDAINPARQGETKTDSDPYDLTKLLNPTESSPLPPPLPPVQWRVVKSHSDVAEYKQYNVSDALRHALDQKLSGSTTSQERESVLGDQQLTNKEAVVIRESKTEDVQKLNGKKEVNQNANGKGIDEKEDFLHQIRTKSFSLRPTVTARPTFSSAPSANVKVTAILEKANAIRQAVASDDGEDDDNWSDT